MTCAALLRRSSRRAASRAEFAWIAAIWRNDSVWVRERLDQTGWGDVEIFFSGDLDEDRITNLLASGARVDTFGVGTSLSTSAQTLPALSVLYKLVEIERDGHVREAAKLSAAKVTYPGRKQVFRFTDSAGHFSKDCVALEDESFPGAEPLLVPVMREGRRLHASPMLSEIQKRCRGQVEHLPAEMRGLASLQSLTPCSHSDRIEGLLEQVRERFAR